MKNHVKTVKIGDEDVARLNLLRERHIGKSDSERFREGLLCLCIREGVEA